MADRLNALASWLLQSGQRRPGFYEADPPRMSQEDMELATGMAYGTPHEPYVRGDRGNREHYARTFVDSQHIPSLLYGLDFSRAQIRDKPGPFRVRDRQAYGVYSPISDRATVAPDPRHSPGSILSHELSHRGQIMATAKGRSDLAQMQASPPPERPPEMSLDDYSRLLDEWQADRTRRRGRAFDLLRADDASHDVMAAEDERAGLNRTALTSTPPTDEGRRIANVLAEEIERLRRERGDFKRMGPR